MAETTNLLQKQDFNYHLKPIEPSKSSLVDTEDDAASEATTLSHTPESSFTPTTLLQIQTHGKKLLSPPILPNELETHIFNPTTDRPIYTNIREKRSSGTCKLVSADDSSFTALARTTYRFGPGRPPMVRIGHDNDTAEEFLMEQKHAFKRTVRFQSARYGNFEWRYGSRAEAKETGSKRLLILDKIVPEGRLRLAQLVRDKEHITPGTAWKSAGYGGLLQMDLRGEVSEMIVLVTCLVMLKKEVDRLIGIQVTMISNGAV